jgi:hypothetical protein
MHNAVVETRVLGLMASPEGHLIQYFQAASYTTATAKLQC